MSSTIFQQACASWFDRVMRSGFAGRAQTVAYALKQCFNEVTHDAWPSQDWLSDRYTISTKTIQRGTNDLEAAGAIAVVTSRRQGESNRCRALFLPVDWGCSDEEQRQIGPAQQDRSVQQSSLPIPPNSSLPLTPEAVHQASLRHCALKSKAEPYNIMKRARLEIIVAKKLGRDGSHILDKLHAFDELCVERLCVAEHYGTLDARLLKTARLAAKYIRAK